MKHTPKIVCPNCGASDVIVITKTLCKCQYCGATLPIPQDGPKTNPTNDPFQNLSDFISSFERIDPRNVATTPLRSSLPTEKAKQCSKQAYKRTSVYWFISLALAIVSIAMFVVACTCMCSTPSAITISVFGVVTFAFFLFTTIKNTKEIERLVKPMQDEIIENVRRDLIKKNLISLTDDEVKVAEQRLKFRARSASLHTNKLQAICGILCVGVALTTCILAPTSNNRIVDLNHDGHCDTCSDVKYHTVDNGHCTYCDYANYHTDSDCDGLCDVCDYDIANRYFEFQLNQDGKSYSVVGVSSELGKISPGGEDFVYAIPREYKGKPVTTICSHIFQDIFAVRVKLIIPSSITRIETYAFSGPVFHSIEFEEKTDWYLVELGKYLTKYDRASFTTPEDIDERALFLYGQFTWVKNPQ